MPRHNHLFAESWAVNVQICFCRGLFVIQQRLGCPDTLLSVLPQAILQKSLDSQKIH